MTLDVYRGRKTTMQQQQQQNLCGVFQQQIIHTKKMNLPYPANKLMDRWMTCDFTSFSTIIQSYQDDGQMIMKGWVQWSPVYGWEEFASSGARTRDR